jgi:hypothetical protein
VESGVVSVTLQDTHNNPTCERIPREPLLCGDTDVIGLDAENNMAEVMAMLEQHHLLGVRVFSRRLIN